MISELWPHQAQAVELLRSSLGSGKRRPVLEIPTGGGKTKTAAAIVDGALRKGKRVIFTVPALSLVDQTVAAFGEEGIRDVGVIQGEHLMTNWLQPVQVASVQTLQRRKIPQADVVIVDECFSGCTLVQTPDGERRIDSLTPGDIVYNAIGFGRVDAVVEQSKQTISLELSNGRTIRVTADHPIFTQDGWRPAGELVKGSRLFSNEAVCAMWRRNATLDRSDGEGPVRSRLEREAFLLGLLRKEAREPDEKPDLTEQDDYDTSRDRPSTAIEGRERASDASRSECVAESPRPGMERGTRIADEASSGDGLSDLLQNRFGEPGFDDRDRNRRADALWEGAFDRPEEDDAVGDVRVENISRHKRQGPDAVFNLRVSGHPSYFAGGVLVHNCHRWFDFYGTWMADAAWAGVPFIGLSATPWTRGLGKHYDDLIRPTTIRGLIDGGFLTQFRVYAPNHPDLTGVRTVAGDFHEGDLAEAMNKPSLVADVVDTWKHRGEDRPTLCFAVDRAHAKSLEQQFLASGVPAGYIDAYTPPAERAVIQRKFHSGEIKVVVNIGTLTTGVDWDVRCIILARPTKSEMLFVQIIGRGLRAKAGKDHCLILDHSDTHVRLGFVTDINHPTLDDGKGRQAAKQRAKEALPKECPACNFLRPPKVAQCPACGFKPERQSQVQCEDGELIELRPDATSATRGTKQLWFSMLIHVAHERGYKSGWAANQYRQKFGVWPRGLAEIPTPPNREVLQYVRYSMIRYSKQRVA